MYFFCPAFSCNLHSNDNLGWCLWPHQRWLRNKMSNGRSTFHGLSSVFTPQPSISARTVSDTGSKVIHCEAILCWILPRFYIPGKHLSFRDGTIWNRRNQEWFLGPIEHAQGFSRQGRSKLHVFRNVIARLGRIVSLCHAEPDEPANLARYLVLRA